MSEFFLLLSITHAFFQQHLLYIGTVPHINSWELPSTTTVLPKGECWSFTSPEQIVPHGPGIQTRNLPDSTLLIVGPVLFPVAFSISQSKCLLWAIIILHFATSSGWCTWVLSSPSCHSSCCSGPTGMDHNSLAVVKNSLFYHCCGWNCWLHYMDNVLVFYGPSISVCELSTSSRLSAIFLSCIMCILKLI